MSGGLWNSEDVGLMHALFGWGVNSPQEARERDPFEDKIISEIAFDVFALMNSYDLWQSGDILEDEYRGQVSDFKQKWLKMSWSSMVLTQIKKSVAECKHMLERDLMDKVGPCYCCECKHWKEKSPDKGFCENTGLTMVWGAFDSCSNGEQQDD